MMPVIWYYPGTLAPHRGTPIRVRHLLKGLSDVGRPIHLFAADDPSSGRMRFTPAPTGNAWRRAEALIAVAEAEGAKTIVGSTFNTLTTLAVCKLLRPRLRIVFEMHGFPEEERYLAGDIGLLRRLAISFGHRLLLPFMDVVTACSETAVRHVSGFGRKTVAVYGGVDLGMFRPDLPHDPLFPPGTVAVGYAGNARGYQGISELVAAYAIAKRGHSELRLALWLSSEPPEDLRALIMADDSITLWKAVPYKEIPRRLAGADILVVPRPDNCVNRLSFPSKLPEYLAMGKAVIATDVGDARVFADGGTGLLVPPDDIPALAKAIARCLDPKLRVSLGAAGAKRAAAYSWETQCALFNSLLDHV